MASTTITNSRPSALWLYNPALDLIVGCGAWSAPLLLVAYFSVASNALAWSVAFYALALLFNYPHYMATLYRAYHRREDFNKYRIFTVHATVLILLTVFVCHFWMRALPWIFTLYLTWSPWHYSGQNYGLFMMFARRAKLNPATRERRAIYAAFLLSYAILLLNFHTGPSSDPLFVSLNIPEAVSWTLQIILGIGFVICSAYGLSSLVAQGGWRDLLPSLTLFTTQFVWFLLPAVLARGEDLHVPQSRYSSGVLAIMHSAQYLWITSYYARREANAEGRESWRPLTYFALLVIGGIALFIPGPWLSSHLFHFDFTPSFLIFTALVNIHHFILDGAIWKLRDGRIAALLLNPQARFSDAATAAGSRLGAGLRWLVSPSAAARGLRVGAALTLLAWATVDQIHYYLALHQNSLADLQRAAALDAYDTSVEMRLAQKDLEAGRADAAVAAWRRAIQADPGNPAARDSLLQYLTGEKRFREAYELTRSSLQKTPQDARLRLNHGIVALQLGHASEAEQSWLKAAAIDPSLPEAHLYLAAQLDAGGKPAQAIAQYGQYLELVAKQGAQKRPPASQLIAVALKLADCQARTDHPDAALQSFELARRIAVEAGAAQLESFASASEAVFQARVGKIASAQRLYQRALQLDAALDDHYSEGVDWYNYGLFLRDAGFPPRLAYASLLKAQALLRPSPDAPATKPLQATILQLDKQLGTEAASIRRAPAAVQQEALWGNR
jgi:tetratricopeptide (TPR) repeat protein